jgi:hypothetical protein
MSRFSFFRVQGTHRYSIDIKVHSLIHHHQLINIPIARAQRSLWIAHKVNDP